MEQYTKPFLSVEAQIDLIISRGLSVPDRDYASDCLKNIGYYRLSGYWHPLKNSELVRNEQGLIIRATYDMFREGATFEQVISLYTYDKHLRLLLLDILERIEIAVRTDVTLELGRHSPWAYRDTALLDQRFVTEVIRGTNESQFEKFIARFDEMVRKSKSDFVVHFKSKYSEPLPIWAAVELWDFGMLSVFFSGMKYRDRRAVAARYGVTPEVFPSWLRSLADTRNICAHHARLWNRTLVSQPKTANTGVNELAHLREGFASERVYSVIAIARHLQRVLNPTSTWAESLISLNESFPKAPGISFSQMGYPENWNQLPLWK